MTVLCFYNVYKKIELENIKKDGAMQYGTRPRITRPQYDLHYDWHATAGHVTDVRYCYIYNTNWLQ